ncbi:M48 family metalloprotease [Thermomonospora catenispora]|uniref:M48 family metalloprotease n=1 Tax=Thermomonospora catenispora TaxID=2493090 RepID=UPI0011236918|nr:M48 family metalloprotease [Thermomonospora catenispora]TNY37277.1 M56 family peptidase [Thermomonospora catenispora]
MNPLTFLPVALTLALSLLLGGVTLPLHPAWTARSLAVTAAMTTLAAVGTAVFIAVNYGATLAPGLAAQVPEWALIGDDSPIPAWLGIPGVAASIASPALIIRLLVRWTADLRAARAASREPLDTDDPIAIAIPGRNGGVLVSRGLLRRLTSRELEVVFQHEHSHLRHHHHRYQAVAALSATLLPPLRPLERRLRLAIERWADEEAAERVGDRALVARTIAKVALTRSAYAGPTPAFAESGVVARVQAMLTAPPDKNTISGPLLLTSTGLVTSSLAAAALQLHHALASTFL